MGAKTNEMAAFSPLLEPLDLVSAMVAFDALHSVKVHDDPVGLHLISSELGAAFLGGTTLASLGAAGLVQELQAGALARTARAFRADG